MNLDEEKALVNFLNKNKDILSWSSSNLKGVSRQVIKHKLQIDPSVKRKKQKLRKMSEDKVADVSADVQRLLDA